MIDGLMFICWCLLLVGAPLVAFAVTESIADRFRA